MKRQNRHFFAEMIVAGYTEKNRRGCEESVGEKPKKKNTPEKTRISPPETATDARISEREG